MDSKYGVYTRVDSSGAVVEDLRGFLRLRTSDLTDASREAEKIPGGYVRRLDDGAILVPGGTWVKS